MVGVVDVDAPSEWDTVADREKLADADTVGVVDGDAPMESDTVADKEREAVADKVAELEAVLLGVPLVAVADAVTDIDAVKLGELHTASDQGVQLDK